MLKTLFVLLLLCSAVARADMDDSRFLYAVRQVETGDKWQIGSKGERTPYQFMASTWARYSATPASYLRPDVVDAVARAHLATIKATLRQRGLPVNVATVAAAWRHGANSKSLMREARTSYATRIKALYYDHA